MTGASFTPMWPLTSTGRCRVAFRGAAGDARKRIVFADARAARKPSSSNASSPPGGPRRHSPTGYPIWPRRARVPGCRRKPVAQGVARPDRARCDEARSWLETTSTSTRATPSVNALANPLVQRLVDTADVHRLQVSRDPTGVRIVDAGIAAEGSIEAGVAIARVCMGGLGRVALRTDGAEGWPTWIDVRSSQPVIACLASRVRRLELVGDQRGG